MGLPVQPFVHKLKNKANFENCHAKLHRVTGTHVCHTLYTYTLSFESHAGWNTFY